MMFGYVAFVGCNWCVCRSPDMPGSVCAKSCQRVVAAKDRAIREDVRDQGSVFVYGCHVHVLKSCACVSSCRVDDFACVVVFVKFSVSFGLCNPWPISFKKDIRDYAVFDDLAWISASGFVLSPERESGICGECRCPSGVCEDVWQSVVSNC